MSCGPFAGAPWRPLDRLRTQDARVAELDKRLSEARPGPGAAADDRRAGRRAARIEGPPAAATSAAPAVADAADGDDAALLPEQIVRPDLGEDERGDELAAVPELFVQSRFQALPLDDATVEDAPTNFLLTRMETRWSGRAVAEGRPRVRAAVPSRPGGASFEIVNDAFVEYYPSERADRTRRASSSSRSGSTSSSRAPTANRRSAASSPATSSRGSATGASCSTPRLATASSCSRRLQRQPLLRRQRIDG